MKSPTLRHLVGLALTSALLCATPIVAGDDPLCPENTTPPESALGKVPGLRTEYCAEISFCDRRSIKRFSFGAASTIAGVEDWDFGFAFRKDDGFGNPGEAVAEATITFREDLENPGKLLQVDWDGILASSRDFLYLCVEPKQADLFLRIDLDSPAPGARQALFQVDGQDWREAGEVLGNPGYLDFQVEQLGPIVPDEKPWTWSPISQVDEKEPLELATFSGPDPFALPEEFLEFFELWAIHHRGTRGNELVDYLLRRERGRANPILMDRSVPGTETDLLFAMDTKSERVQLPSGDWASAIGLIDDLRPAGGLYYDSGLFEEIFPTQEPSYANAQLWQIEDFLCLSAYNFDTYAIDSWCTWDLESFSQLPSVEDPRGLGFTDKVFGDNGFQVSSNPRGHEVVFTNKNSSNELWVQGYEVEPSGFGPDHDLSLVGSFAFPLATDDPPPEQTPQYLNESDSLWVDATRLPGFCWESISPRVGVTYALAGERRSGRMKLHETRIFTGGETATSTYDLGEAGFGPDNFFGLNLTEGPAGAVHAFWVNEEGLQHRGLTCGGSGPILTNFTNVVDDQPEITAGGPLGATYGGSYFNDTPTEGRFANNLFFGYDDGTGLATFTGPVPPCIPDGRTLCLSEGRFEVEALWTRNSGESGPGVAVPLTADTGYFWFFGEDNVEMLIKVLDACGPPLNNRFWVFAGGLTNVEVDIRVRDTLTGQLRTYGNPPGTPFQPIQDTQAFATCPESDGLLTSNGDSADSLDELLLLGEQAAWRETATRLASEIKSWVEDYRSASPANVAGGPGCTPSDTALCLSDGRFRVETTWTRSNGQTGQGRAQPLTADTGDFWFFDEANIEMVVKVLDVCGPALNDRFWVFAGGLTNVRVDLEVTDTLTGETMSYVNPQGTPFQPIQDTDAFATCP